MQENNTIKQKTREIIKGKYGILGLTESWDQRSSGTRKKKKRDQGGPS